MNSSAVAFFTCLLVLYVQGQLADRSNQCHCSNDYINWINTKLIKGEPAIHYPSIFCSNMEIIITLTGNKRKCVNPKSRLGRIIMRNIAKYGKKNEGVSATMASSLHTSTRLPSSSTALKIE